jgi:hypothetical protein
MKKIILVTALSIMFLAILLVSCAKTTVAPLTDDDVLALYQKATEVYGWFDLTTIPHDIERYIEKGGMQYFEVTQPGITSKQALADYLDGLFAASITEDLMAMASDRYVEQEGKLYVMPADRGSDILKGEETYEVIRESEDQIKLTVIVEVYDDPEKMNVTGHEQYDFILKYSDDRWKFSNFRMVR